MISLKIAMRQNSIQIQMIYFKQENSSVSLEEVMRKKVGIYLVQENFLLHQVSFISPSKSNHCSSENYCVHTQGYTYKTIFPSLLYGLISTGFSQWEVLTRTEQRKKNEVGQSCSQIPPPSGIVSIKELNQKSQPFSQPLARSSGNIFLSPSQDQ